MQLRTSTPGSAVRPEPFGQRLPARTRAHTKYQATLFLIHSPTHWPIATIFSFTQWANHAKKRNFLNWNHQALIHSNCLMFPSIRLASHEKCYPKLLQSQTTCCIISYHILCEHTKRKKLCDGHEKCHSRELDMLISIFFCVHTKNKNFLRLIKPRDPKSPSLVQFIQCRHVVVFKLLIGLQLSICFFLGSSACCVYLLTFFLIKLHLQIFYFYFINSHLVGN